MQHQWNKHDVLCDIMWGVYFPLISFNVGTYSTLSGGTYFTLTLSLFQLFIEAMMYKQRQSKASASI